MIDFQSNVYFLIEQKIYLHTYMSHISKTFCLTFLLQLLPDTKSITQTTRITLQNAEKCQPYTQYIERLVGYSVIDQHICAFYEFEEYWVCVAMLKRYLF